MQGLRPEVFSSIVGDVYDCALNPDGWTAAQTRVSTAMNAVYTSISLSDPNFAQPSLAIRIVKINVLAPISPRGDVIQGKCKLKTQRAGHADSLS